VHDGLQNILIVLEMLTAAIYHLYAFPYQEYSSNIIRLKFWSAFYDVLNPYDVVTHSQNSFIIKKKKLKIKANIQEDQNEEHLEEEEEEEEDEEVEIINFNGADKIPSADFARFIGGHRYTVLRQTV